MDFKQWETRSLKEIGRAIASGTIDPRELTEYYLAKIEAEPEKDKIFIKVLAKSAMQEAAASKKRAEENRRLSNLDGITIAWKDNFDIKGFPTTAGVPLLADKIANENAKACDIALNAGLVSIGKTNMSELAFSGLGINPAYGTPSNRFDSQSKRVPGGSSSGSAVAVSKGLCQAAIGTDTGGSVRIPAAWNSLVGLKTTKGLISTKGITPLSETLDTVGFFTKTVDDSASLCELFSGLAEVDLSRRSIEGERLLLCKSAVWDGIDEAVAKVISLAIDKISDAGAKVVEGEPPQFGETLGLIKSKGHIVNYEGNKNWGKFLRANRGAIYSGVMERFEIGERIKESDIKEVYAGVKELGEKFTRSVDSFSAVVMPTVVREPAVISELENSAELYREENLLALRNSMLVNLLGLCAITIPAGFTENGLPVGLMLVSKPFSETALLQIAKAVENVLAK